MSIVAVTGGRDYRPTRADAFALRDKLHELEATLVRHGGCRGLDVWAGIVAMRLSLDVEVWLPTLDLVEEWRTKHGEGAGVIVRPTTGWAWPSAGPLRNRVMLRGRDGRLPADALIAFPGGRGTASAMREADAARIGVHKLGR